MKSNRLILIISGLLIEVLYIVYRSLDTQPAQSVIKYMVIFAGVFILLAVTWFLLKEETFSRFYITTILVFSFIFGLTLLTAPPHQSDDIYRYLWDGKLQTVGLSPYAYAPNDPILTPWHSDQLPALVNFPHVKTIYPPVAQLVFRLSYTLFGESAGGLKFLFLLALLGAGWFFYSILKNNTRDPRLLLFFAWNPLIVMETAINGHLDILMAFFLLLFLYLFFNRRPILSGIALGLAVLTKLIPIILAPLVLGYFLWGKRKDLATNKEKFLTVLRFFGPMVLTIAGFYLLYIESAGNMFATALHYAGNWYFNNPLFQAILSIVELNRTAHAVSFSLFALTYAVILFKPMEIEKKFFYAFLAFTFMNPTLHPWYLTVLLALLCIYRSNPVILWSGLVFTAYAVVYQYKTTGVWEDSWLIMTIQYLPVAVMWMINFTFTLKKTNNEKLTT
ncbi:MAG: DUF2029 domain-containing protein [bacterium]|nr:DUF2029 domain-containing protein [bacterium]